MLQDDFVEENINRLTSALEHKQADGKYQNRFNYVLARALECRGHDAKISAKFPMDFIKSMRSFVNHRELEKSWVGRNSILMVFADLLDDDCECARICNLKLDHLQVDYLGLVGKLRKRFQDGSAVDESTVNDMSEAERKLLNTSLTLAGRVLREGRYLEKKISGYLLMFFSFFFGLYVMYKFITLKERND